MIYTMEKVMEFRVSKLINEAQFLCNKRGMRTMKTINGGIIDKPFEIKQFLKATSVLRIPCKIKTFGNWKDSDILLENPNEELVIYGYTENLQGGYVTIESINGGHCTIIPVDIITELTVPNNLKVKI